MEDEKRQNTFVETHRWYLGCQKAEIQIREGLEELSNIRLGRFNKNSSREVHEARLSSVLLWRYNHELISKD